VNVTEATRSYESWLRAQCEANDKDLDYKHDEMADNAFAFFRGTYYRWAQVWQRHLPDLTTAPPVLAVGDSHVENFGTWRDADGRLVWGVNDFDEADELPYTNDLVRLATSFRFAKTAATLDVKSSKVCGWLLAGYRTQLQREGEPFVLEEHHPELRAMAMAEDREPFEFWKKVTKVLKDEPAAPPPGVLERLSESLPVPAGEAAVRFRYKVGVGSLGKPRYILLSKWAGSWVAREAKAVTPPSTAWANNTPTPFRAAELERRAVRCPDPFYQPGERWIVRRIAPRSYRIELEDLTRVTDVRVLFLAMGAETANVHLGTADARPAILADLARRPEGWLAESSVAMYNAIRADWENFKENGP
jgi:hypothetical protein